MQLACCRLTALVASKTRIARSRAARRSSSLKLPLAHAFTMFDTACHLRQHTSAYVSTLRQLMSAYASRHHLRFTSAFVRHTSAYVGIRHTNEHLRRHNEPLYSLPLLDSCPPARLPLRAAPQQRSSARISRRRSLRSAGDEQQRVCPSISRILVLYRIAST